ncbi:OmpA family protein [Paraliomyxa miuraensis]|uniref:OmpA family protein n=1 Tax=Paraliomyxa miuraensis TaxID=376150 RepID=UPI002250A666|nr:OmpA family protein [Paraliomyxa miuraensis]MCX4244431.1 OmpA family protein [Paraliomyxa miuraensis]
MGRIPPLVASSLGLLLSPAAWAGPPALPDGDAAPAEPAPAEPAADPGATATAPAEPEPASAGVDGSASGSIDLGAEIGDAGLSGSSDAEGESKRGRRGKKNDKSKDASGEADGSDPGMVRGRREPMMNTNRGAAGLFTTTLPDVGGKYTFRFKLHTDFFRKEGFIYEGSAGPDQHARVRGGVAMAFSPFEWGEVFMSVNSQANRNSREQRDRQDAEAIFALGDIDFGIKGAYRLKKKAKGIGVGGQVGVGLLSGSERLLTSGVNVWFDGMFAVDVRYMTKKAFPFRFTTNIGWIYDSSLGIAPFGRVSDDISREVLRFSLGGNHSRVRMKYAVDFPVRLGKERQFGIDPIIEWAWDVSTQEESDAFARADALPSPLPRSSQWLTLGLRANVVSGLHVEAAADIGMVSPNFEFGPPVPPWQMMLGLGWSFDPNPTVKEVEVPVDAPPPPPEPAPIEGRIIGQVIDPAGTPIPDAKIVFPGLTSTALLTDGSGGFTSFRFPAGQVPVQVVVNGQVLAETTAEVANGQDTNLTIQLEQAPAPPTGVVRGAVTDASGAPVEFNMQVTGQGVDQSFGSTGNLIALELYVGDYSGTITAPGFKAKQVRFTVAEGGEIQINETLEPETPPDTSKIKASRKGIRIKGGIGYDGDSVSSRSEEGLTQLATFLKAHPEYKVIQINVHTDDRGSPGKRSQDRADAVKAFLVTRGVSPDRVVAKGYGDSKPVAVNLTAAGRAKNNRTTISVKEFGG